MASTLSQMPCVLPAGNDIRYTSRDGQRIILPSFHTFDRQCIAIRGKYSRKVSRRRKCNLKSQNQGTEDVYNGILAPKPPPPLVLVFHSILLVFIHGCFEVGLFHGRYINAFFICSWGYKPLLSSWPRHHLHRHFSYGGFIRNPLDHRVRHSEKGWHVFAGGPRAYSPVWL